MKDNIKNFVKVANFIADEARSISLAYFKKKLKIKSKNKKIFDPVSIADINVQKKINKLIKKHFPTHSILGEEQSFENISYRCCRVHWNACREPIGPARRHCFWN